MPDRIPALRRKSALLSVGGTRDSARGLGAWHSCGIGMFRAGHPLKIAPGTQNVAQEMATNIAGFAGLSGSWRGEASFPKARRSTLLRTGTRSAPAWRADPLRRGKSEHAQAEALLPHLGPGMLVLVDRGYFGFRLQSAASETGADLLWRAPAGVGTHPAGEPFEDESWPAELREPGSGRRRSRGACRGRIRR